MKAAVAVPHGNVWVDVKVVQHSKTLFFYVMHHFCLGICCSPIAQAAVFLWWLHVLICLIVSTRVSRHASVSDTEAVSLTLCRGSFASD